MNLANVYEVISSYSLPSSDFKLHQKAPNEYVWLIDTSDTLGWGYSAYDEIASPETLALLEDAAQKLEGNPEFVRVLFAANLCKVEPQAAWKKHMPEHLWPLFWKELENMTKSLRTEDRGVRPMTTEPMQWHLVHDSPPQVGQRIVALYTDGSGAVMGLVGEEAGELFIFQEIIQDLHLDFEEKDCLCFISECSYWALLPEGYTLWGEE